MATSYSSAAERRLGLQPGQRVYRITDTAHGGAKVAWVRAYTSAGAMALARRIGSLGGIKPRVSVVPQSSAAAVMRGKFPSLEELLRHFGRQNPASRKHAARQRRTKKAPRTRSRKRRRVSTAARGRRGAKRAGRRNPTALLVSARQFGKGAHLITRQVTRLEYTHPELVHGPRYHDFDPPVELWALPNGALLLRHPRHRLWSDIEVRASE